MIIKSATDRDAQAKHTEEISERLDLPAPAHIKADFESFDEYHKSYSSLVAEEARHSIAAALGDIFEKKTNKPTDRGLVKVKILSQRTFSGHDGEDRQYVECWTMKPLSPKHRDDLRAGSVVALSSPGKLHDPEEVILGRVALGSTEPSRRTYARPDRFYCSLCI